MSLQSPQGCVPDLALWELTGSCFLEPELNPASALEKQLSVGTWRIHFLLFPGPRCLNSELLQTSRKRGEEMEQGTGKEATPCTCLNIKFLQEASDGLWRQDTGEEVSFLGSSVREIMLEHTCPESAIHPPFSVRLPHSLQREMFLFISKNSRPTEKQMPWLDSFLMTALVKKDLKV